MTAKRPAGPVDEVLQRRVPAALLITAAGIGLIPAAALAAAAITLATGGAL